MRGDTENSATCKKVICFHSTDGLSFVVTCHQAPGRVEFTIQGEDGFREIELSRAEALEVADFIKRGV